MAQGAGGGKNRKYGRGKRSPSAIRYKAENREVKNAKRKWRKAVDAALTPKFPSVPRGTARFLRRRPKQDAFAAAHAAQ